MSDTVPHIPDQKRLKEYAGAKPLVTGRTFETELGKYVLAGPIEEGGMAEVWRAYDENNETVAIKFIRQKFIDNSDYWIRLRKEAKFMQEMDHPNVVKVFEYVEQEDLCFIVMEYIDGGTLYDLMAEDAGILQIDTQFEQKLSEGALPIANVPLNIAVNIVKGVADIYVKAHLAGHRIVHRDLKPENILLDKERNPRLSDFGIGRDLDESLRLTKTGALPGTFVYMAPEAIIDPDQISVQSDMYSLGVIFYYMLAGRPPFYSSDPGKTLNMHCDAAPQPLQGLNPNIPDGISGVVDCMLRKHPNSRFSPAGLIAALNRVEAGKEPEYPALIELEGTMNSSRDSGEGEGLLGRFRRLLGLK